MGVQKLLLPVRGVAMIDRVIEACADFPTLVVASPQIAEHLRASEVTVVLNTEADRGMSHSLRLAHAAIAPERAIAVFLGDKPLVTRELARRVVKAAQAASADVCFPQRDGVGGHPVYFSPRARDRIAGLSGDTLQSLRDAPGLCRAIVPTAEEGAYLDIDDPGALHALEE